MKRPNIILIILDTLRADHLSCYGYKKKTSPNLDKIASEGVLYENCFSVAPWTVPSFASIFTGMYPSSHCVDIDKPFLNGAYTTLAESLRDHDYHTASVSSNAWIGSQTNFDRGFDEFWKMWQVVQGTMDLKGWRLYSKFSNNNFSQKSFLDLILTKEKWQNLVNSFYGMAIHKRYDYGALRATRKARSLVTKYLNKTHQNKPIFLNINLLETHIFYKPPIGFRNLFLPKGLTYKEAAQVNQDPWEYVFGNKPMSEKDFEILRALYDAEIYYQDYRLGQLFRYLKSTQLLDNSIVIIMADHGENIGDHGLMDHQYSLHDTLIQIPMVVYAPEYFGKAKRIDHFVQTVDVFPTLMKLTDSTLSAKLRNQLKAGRSLLPEDIQSSPRSYVYSEYLQPQPRAEVLKNRFPQGNFKKYERALRSVRNKQHKYIWASNGDHEFYDLNVDPNENKNLYQHYEHLVDQEFKPLLEKELNGYFKRKKEGYTVDASTKRILEGLGYI